MKTIILNAQRILKGDLLEPCFITIEDGHITEIKSKKEYTPSNAELIDVKGALVTSGLIDLHVHLREPGFTHKETIRSGSQAAARGGFTTICAMPNTNPTPDTEDRLHDFYEIVKKEAVVHVLSYAPITQGLKSNLQVNQEELLKAGAIAFTNDGLGVQDGNTMFQAMKQAASLKAIIAAHAEDESLKGNGIIHEGEVSIRMGLPGIPSVSESSQIARDLLLAEASGVHYHVCHVSTKESVRVIREAKKAGINVTCEVTPHHLLLCDEDLLNDANYKMNPPLRSKADQKALLEGLIDGTIDCIASDHAPHSLEEKAQGLLKAPFGIIGLEYGFGLLYTHFVKTGLITTEALVNWMSSKPAQCFDLECGSLSVGSVADLAFFDLENEVTIPNHFVSKSSNSPFIGRKIVGDAVMTMVEGKIVWRS
jgi:dihydroorotase